MKSKAGTAVRNTSLVVCLLALSSAAGAFAVPPPSFATATAAASASASSSSSTGRHQPPNSGARTVATVAPPPTASTAAKTLLRLQGGAVSQDLKSPADLYNGAVNAGAAKAGADFGKIFKLGVVAGAHIGFGAYLAITVGGACPGIAAENPGLQKIITGAFGLPFGLIMTLVTGGELFTGNTALVTAAWREGKTSGKNLAKNWVASYLGNFVGSLILAYLAYKSNTLGSLPGAVNLATAKCAAPWDVAFTRGILCNWLVCMAVSAAAVRGGKGRKLPEGLRDNGCLRYFPTLTPAVSFCLLSSILLYNVTIPSRL